MKWTADGPTAQRVTAHSEARTCSKWPNPTLAGMCPKEEKQEK
ncbi:MAG: hypothetical protein WCQ95_11210 [Bacteroidota bacterium]